MCWIFIFYFFTVSWKTDLTFIFFLCRQHQAKENVSIMITDTLAMIFELICFLQKSDVCFSAIRK